MKQNQICACCKYSQPDWSKRKNIEYYCDNALSERHGNNVEHCDACKFFKGILLHFEGEEQQTSPIKITKDGRLYLYFTALSNLRKYRMDKTTGEVQIAPYWTRTKMWVTYEE